MNLLKKINIIFSRRDKIKYIMMLILIVVGALIELLGVSVILPYIQIITEPNKISESKYLSNIYQWLGASSIKEFLAYLSITIIIIFFIKNVYLFLMYYLQYKLVYGSQMKLSVRLMDCYMKKPYAFHLQKNSSEIVRGVINDTGQFIQVLMNVLSMISEFLITVLLSGYLFLLDPIVMIVLVVFLGVSIFLYLKVIKEKVRLYGKMFQTSSSNLIKSINQAIGGLKDMKVLHREEFFIESYAKVGSEYVRSIRGTNTLGIIPKYSLEVICITVMLGMVTIKLFAGEDVLSLIPQLSAFAVAAIRLLPAVNRINNNINTIMYYKPSIDLVYHDIIETEGTEKLSDKNNKFFEDSKKADVIKIRDLSYHYDGNDKNILDNVNVEIPIGKSVGIVGTSGSGKTTLIDILLGVLEPITGSVLYGDLPIRDYPISWSKKLGYIPQTIYLTDDTIRNNIAFGIKAKDIDEEQLERVIIEAQLEDLIKSQPNGLDTVIGERGVRISGGQRQRIGIARALYHNPDILVLDEATSALDNDTETAIMEAVNHFKGKKTLIIIAHRLSTIEKCDIVYRVENGKVIREKITN